MGPYYRAKVKLAAAYQGSLGVKYVVELFKWLYGLVTVASVVLSLAKAFDLTPDSLEYAPGYTWKLALVGTIWVFFTWWSTVGRRHV